MTLLNVLQAVSIGAIRFWGNRPIAFTPVEAVRSIAERYSFVKYPNSPAELVIDEPNASFTFRLGKCQVGARTISIEMLQIFQHAIAVTTRSSTDDSDLVLNDGLDWVVRSFGAQYELIRPGLAHRSELEFGLDKPLPEFFPQLRDFGREVGSSLTDFWEKKPDYELISLNFGFDRLKYPTVAPANVSIERRSDMPFDQNVYFSHAPLRTEKHLAVLKTFETACL